MEMKEKVKIMKEVLDTLEGKQEGIQYLLIQMGKLGVQSNADKMEFSIEADIEGSRYKIEAKVELIEL